MPLLIVLKKPPITLVAKGKLTKRYIQKAARVLDGVIQEIAMDGLPMIIPVHEESNIGYIKEISQEQYDEMEAKRKDREAQNEGRVVRPDITMGPPGRKFRKGH